MLFSKVTIFAYQKDSSVSEEHANKINTIHSMLRKKDKSNTSCVKYEV